MLRNVITIKTLQNFHIRLILILMLISFPFIGTDCDENVISESTTADIAGTWKLVYVGGNLQDICLGEIVTFQSNGGATLQCPNKPPISRNYTISNNVLTYTQTQMKYNITELNQTTLTLEGVNVGRILRYDKVPADSEGHGNYGISDGVNSSE
jgi:hypothetical protein